MSALEETFQTWLQCRAPKASKNSDPNKPQEVKKVIECDVYSLPLDLLFHGVPTVSADEDAGQKGGSTGTVVHTSTEFSRDTNKGLTCLTCKLTFSSRDEQYGHFKSDLHTHNLNRKLRGEAPLDPLHFTANNDPTEIQSDIDEENSDSYEESEESDVDLLEETEEQGVDSLHQVHTSLPYGTVSKSYHPKSGPVYHFHFLHLPKHTLSLSAALFPAQSILSKRNWYESSHPLFPLTLSHLLSLRSKPMIAVLLLKSGKFSGAIFDNSQSPGKLVVHKVLKRYTVRAKAGGGQSSHDNKSGKARSMGAQLRRYGEKALEEDVHRLLTVWGDYLDHCSLLLIGSTKKMRPVLFEGAEREKDRHVNLLKKDDDRLVFLPFGIDKVTLESAQHVHRRVVGGRVSPRGEERVEEERERSQLAVGLSEIHLKEEKKQSKNQKEKGEKRKEERREERQEERDDLPPCPPSQSLLQACETLSDTALLFFLSELHAEVEREGEWEWAPLLSYPRSLDDLDTPLHVLARRNLPLSIERLLREGARPEREDVRGRPPYLCCGGKESRNAFRRARAEMGEEGYDWDRGAVPEALTDTLLSQQKLKEKEKKKRAAQRKREQKERDEERAKEMQALQEAVAVAQAAEKVEEEERRRAAAGVCGFCRVELYRKESYDVLGSRCCSTQCVLQLRRRVQAEAALSRFQPKS